MTLQRSPARGHRRQLSTVAEEVQPAAKARAIPMLNLEPLTQKQEPYAGPQELYQSTVYTSVATDVRTSASASNYSDTAVHTGGHALLSDLPDRSRQGYDGAGSPAADEEPPLISFTPPPRKVVAKLAKMFQPGPSRLSNKCRRGSGDGQDAAGEQLLPLKHNAGDRDIADSRHFSPLKHHIRAACPAGTTAAPGACRLAVEAGPRQSHLDFFLRDAAAATAKFRYDTLSLILPQQAHTVHAPCRCVITFMACTQHEP